MTNFEKFIASKQYTDDLYQYNDCYEGNGYVYMGHLVIEPWDSVDSYLIIENMEYIKPIEELERILFNWAVSAGYFN